MSFNDILIQKRKEFFTQSFQSYLLTSTANPALVSQIGCACWLVTLKWLCEKLFFFYFVISFLDLEMYLFQEVRNPELGFPNQEFIQLW